MRLDFTGKRKPHYWDAVEHFRGDLVLVSSEVAFGYMPMNCASWRFGDEAGAMNQALAKLSDRVNFCAAGAAYAVKIPTLLM